MKTEEVKGTGKPFTRTTVSLGQGEGVLEDDKKRELQGNCSIDLVESDKFGKQVQFIVWNTTDQGVVTRPRSLGQTGRYHRLGLYFPVNRLSEIITALCKFEQVEAPYLVEVTDPAEASRLVDRGPYRLERFSTTRNAYILVRAGGRNAQDD